MRSFVSNFRLHLTEANACGDDEMVWGLLRKLQNLSFDFTAQGSASEELGKERPVRALHSDEAPQAGSHWTSSLSDFGVIFG